MTTYLHVRKSKVGIHILQKCDSYDDFVVRMKKSETVFKNSNDLL